MPLGTCHLQTLYFSQKVHINKEEIVKVFVTTGVKWDSFKEASYRLCVLNVKGKCNSYFITILGLPLLAAIKVVFGSR